MGRRSGSLAATGAYTLLAMLLTWPLARGLTRDLPADLGDPVLNSWVLAWVTEHLLRMIGGDFSALREYWNANIFYPNPLALAYSEHLTPQALTILPVYALTKNPILSYNLVVLSTFVLSALGMFLYVADITGCRRAAFVAGLAYGFAPYRFGTLPHIQVLSSMWMPFAWLGFRRFFETRRLTLLAGGAAAWIAQNLSCGYYLLFFSPVMVLYLVWEITVRGLWFDKRMLARVATAFIIVVIITVPFLIPYAEVRRLGFSPRSLGETIRFSADVYAYLTADITLKLWGRIVRAWPRPEGSLFPGFMIMMLAAIAILDQWKRSRGATVQARTAERVVAGAVALSAALLMALLFGWSFRIEPAGLVEIKITDIGRLSLVLVGLSAVLLAFSPRARQTFTNWVSSPVGILVCLTGLAWLLSFGPQIYSRGKLVADPNLYAFLYAFVPGFDGLRVPARFAMIVALGLAALAGCGAAVIAGRRHGGWLVALAAVCIVMESWAVPIPVNVNPTEYKQAGLIPLPDHLSTGRDQPAVYRFVAELPASSVMLEMPFGEVAFEARYMFYSIFHRRRLVNGYSGGAPDRYGLWAERLKDFADRPDLAWQSVLNAGTTHIVVHEGSYADNNGARVSDWARSHGAMELVTFGTDRVFTVPR